MIRFILLFFFTTTLFATTLTKHTFYEKPDRIDLMLTFDAPYLGKIAKTQNKMGTILVLENVTIPEKKFTKKLDSDIVKGITIAAMDQKAIIELQSPHEINVVASKTIDNRGLRIRIQKAASVQNESDIPRPIPTPVESKTDDYNFSFAFLKIMLVLGGLILLLWFLKKWMEKKNGTAWLFGETQDTNTIKILAQKPVDMKNKVVLLSHQDKKYLLLLGETNLLLDRFEVEEDEAAFDTLLQNSGKKLGDYLKK